MSITGNSTYLVFNYQISSSKIELVVLQVKAGNTEALKAMEYTDEYVVDGWRGFKYALDSDADAIQIVAKKTGITTNIEFVLIDLVAVRSDLETGKCTISLPQESIRRYVVALYGGAEPQGLLWPGPHV